MKSKPVIIPLPKNPSITIKVIPGHFATTNVHVSHYIDMTEMKYSILAAKAVAKELAVPYLNRALVDTVVSMEGTEVIGAFLAQELSQDGISVMNANRDIAILTPMYNVNKQLTFPSNVREQIRNRHVVLLMPSVSSGRAMRIARECIQYYGGHLAGISSLMNSNVTDLQDIHSVFHRTDIPEYQYYAAADCAMCKAGIPLDAIISSVGYTTIQGP